MDGPDLVGDKDAVGGNSSPEDSFYEKLYKVNEPSGLSLLINFWQTNLDLFEFYEHVTKRGGYHQVTKDRRWGEVASIMNPESRSLLPDQLQKIYGSFLCVFEQIHHYRSTSKVAAMSGNPLNGVLLSCIRRKRKLGHHSPVPVIHFGAVQLLHVKRKCLEQSNQPSTAVH